MSDARSGVRLRHTVTVQQLRSCLRGAIDRIRFEQHRVLVVHHGRPIIALVTVRDLEQSSAPTPAAATKKGSPPRSPRPSANWPYRHQRRRGSYNPGD